MRTKGQSLLEFLRDAATLRQQRLATYRSGDIVLWFADLPTAGPGSRTPILNLEGDAGSDYWLEVRKTRAPVRPRASEELLDWVRSEDLDTPDREPQLLTEITLLVDAPESESSGSAAQQGGAATRVPEVRRLEQHPEIEDLWLEYLVNDWEPWAERMRHWQRVQDVYETVDSMRRRLEGAEEHWELFLGVGLLQWRDPADVIVKRHLLTAPAEIEFDAARGVLTVIPGGSFEAFRVELDMLERKDQPRLEEGMLAQRLGEVDIRVWDRTSVGEVLREIANRARPDSQVYETALEPEAPAGEVFSVYYAPALILRERRPRAFIEVMDRLLAQVGEDPTSTTTAPWELFIAEGTPQSIGDVPAEPKCVEPPGRLFFPLPTNDEQRHIAERVGAWPCVVVKGPPGTGKSHTIANLMCHSLAMGERVLVTAATAKALTVLRDKLPRDLQDLCVTALGSSREEQDLLREGVARILAGRNQWKGPLWAQTDMERLEKELLDVEGKLASVERQLRECREAELHRHTLSGGYEGTLAQIARQVEAGRDAFGWFPEVASGLPAFPLGPSEVELLTEVHGQLAPELEREFELDTGEFEVIPPEEFARIVSELRAAEERVRQAEAKADGAKQEALTEAPAATLEVAATTIRALDDSIPRATRVLSNHLERMLGDLLTGRRDHWQRLMEQSQSMVAQLGATLKQLEQTRVDVPADVDLRHLLVDAERRLAHFTGGGRRGLAFLKPAILRETGYVEAGCLVNGQPPRRPDQLAKLIAFLRARTLLENLGQLWPDRLEWSTTQSAVALSQAEELLSELSHLLALVGSSEQDALPCIPIASRPTLVNHGERTAWLAAIEAELAAREVQQVREPLDACAQRMHACLDLGDAHPCLGALASALAKREVVAWRQAWERRQELRHMQLKLAEYGRLLALLSQASAEVEETIRASQGGPEWGPRLARIQQAWAWAGARQWISDVRDAERYQELILQSHQFQRQLETKTEEAASVRAWHAFFQRLDPVTLQSLHAWTKAIARVGRGTGKHAYRHRRTARGYLMNCIPRIPAWIMPMHRLWDTIQAEPGLFDTVIIDEASQAGMDGLALLLLAKRIIVVGDDRQNSPEAVGVRENDIARLVSDHLSEFSFRREFRPDASLFDHAERAFGNLIALREHFRCVPEIIRFSNDLCYRDAPLIPLRQAPPDRLPPLKAVFVEGGTTKGEGQRITNQAEAEALVRAVLDCINDEAYDGKTMGVIALQGRAQADLIARMLARELDPSVIEERQLRCGVPATFQGDERDVMFLSLVAASNKRYRTISGQAYERRYNVAMSRARDQVWLFHSLQTQDLSARCLRYRLITFFRTPHQAVLDQLEGERERLERAARKAPREMGTQPEPYESWFEMDVALELLRRGYTVYPQFEVVGRRIDLVIEGGDARLAVECDGDTWHGPDQYEDDMARQRQLERAGWTFVRVRESAFYADRTQAIEEVIRACDELGVHPASTHAEPDLVLQQDTGGADAARNREHDELEEREAAEDELDDVAATDQGPFSGYSPDLHFPDPRNAPTSNVRRALQTIIDRDGPLTRASVYRLYVEGCPEIQRVGKTIRQALNRALGPMLRSKEIEQVDELGTRRPEGLVLHPAGGARVHVRPAGRRDLIEIPPSELAVVVKRLRADSLLGDLPEETLFRRVLDHYGYGRLTAVRRKHLRRILALVGE